MLTTLTNFITVNSFDSFFFSFSSFSSCWWLGHPLQAVDIRVRIFNKLYWVGIFTCQDHIIQASTKAVSVWVNKWQISQGLGLVKTRGLWQYLKRISLYYELPILRNIALISYCSERYYCEFTGCAFPKDLSFPNSYETIQHITKSPYDKISVNIYCRFRIINLRSSKWS